VNVTYGGASNILKVSGVGEDFICYTNKTHLANYGYLHLYFISNATDVQISQYQVRLADVSMTRVAWINNTIEQKDRSLFVFNTEDWSTIEINDDPLVGGIRLEVEGDIFIDGTLLAYTCQNTTIEAYGILTHELISHTIDVEDIGDEMAIFGLYEDNLGLTATWDTSVWDTYIDEFIYTVYEPYKQGLCLEDDIICSYFTHVGLNKTLSLYSMEYDGNPELTNATTGVGCSRDGIEKLDNGTYAISYLRLFKVYVGFLIPYEEEEAQERIHDVHHVEYETALGTEPANEGGLTSWLLIILVITMSAVAIYYIATKEKRKKGGADYYEK
jgi:hypothetical protein